MEQHVLKQKNPVFGVFYTWYFFDISIDIERLNYMHFASVYLSLQGLMALTKFALRFKFKHVPEYSARLACLRGRTETFWM